MLTFSYTIPWVIPLQVSLTVSAQVTLDGTLGQRGALPGPNYQIGADLGQQHGGNLFHSFQDFSLQRYESATFSGPTTVQNIISRVTGGNASNLDGLIRSTIPHADMYFLNPYGILFGPHARLDIQGGFHASTADYLRLNDGGRFDTRQPSNSVLTIAPIVAFGFLTNSPAKLSIEGSQLSTIEGKTQSFVGGELSIKGGQLLVPSGRFNLASIAQAGEVNVPTLETPALAKQGVIRISDQANLNVNGVSGGEIVIRGGQLFVTDSTLQANTLGAQNGRGINMKLTESVNLSGKSAQITSHTFGDGNAGPITVTTPNLTINQGNLLSNSFGKGAAGNIQVDTLQTAIHEGGAISSDSANAGYAGNLTIIAQEGLFLVDKRIFLERETAEFVSQLSSTALGRGRGGRIVVRTSQLTLDGASISSQSHLIGDAGEIMIDADSIEIHNGGLISATTLSQSSGKGGNITLNVKESILIDGFRAGFAISKTDVFKNMQSAIAAITFGAGTAGNLHLSAKELIVANNAVIGAATGSTGNAGSLTIEVNKLYLKTGGLITNSSGGIVGGKLFLGTGASGTAKIAAKESIIATGQGLFNPSGILSNTLVSGQGGNIEIQTKALQLAEGAELSASSLGRGNAGTLNIQADSIQLTNGGHITTSAKNATGGNITLTTPEVLFLQKGEITTSVKTGKGDGGNITILKPVFVILTKAQIVAQADEGQGGNIKVQANQFIATPDSLVSASSNKGISGNVVITSPDHNLGGKLSLFTTKSLGATSQLKNPCGAKSLEEIEHPRFKFYVFPLAGSRLSAEDWRPSPPVLALRENTPATSPTGKSPSSASNHHQDTSAKKQPEYQPVLLMMECLKK